MEPPQISKVSEGNGRQESPRILPPGAGDLHSKIRPTRYTPRFTRPQEFFGQCPNLMRPYETGLRIATSEVGPLGPTPCVASKGLLSPEASGAEAPEGGTVNVGAEAPTSEGLVRFHESSN